MFNAEDVKGILMDGQLSFMGVVQHAFELYDGRAELFSREQIAEPNGDQEQKPEAEPTAEPSSLRQFWQVELPLSH